MVTDMESLLTCKCQKQEADKKIEKDLSFSIFRIEKKAYASFLMTSLPL